MNTPKCDRCGHEIACDEQGKYVDGQELALSGKIPYPYTPLTLCEGCIEEFWLSWWTGCGAPVPRAIQKYHRFPQ
ncbi:hypothetical protein HHJ78_10995 [Mobiluncus mulieris]|uniref:Uncharacterized protein n=1 Tax=Mobiluncus mulieris TaxID=2052 RepID=A0A7Y0U2Y5_9ACTO|nr:hypothetical protein [Mobiluncus mulieris]NMW66011.1 hypothetical protein [Mobiluncus mulieris]